MLIARLSLSLSLFETTNVLTCCYARASREFETRAINVAIVSKETGCCRLLYSIEKKSQYPVLEFHLYISRLYIFAARRIDSTNRNRHAFFLCPQLQLLCLRNRKRGSLMEYIERSLPWNQFGILRRLACEKEKEKERQREDK